MPPAEALDAITLARDDGQPPSAAAAAEPDPDGDNEPDSAGVVAAVLGRPAWPTSADRRLVPGDSGADQAGSQRPASILPGARVAPADSGRPAEPAPQVFLADASRAAVAWARERYLGLSSACGISVALAGCAAIWFSAGTRIGVLRGVAALLASYLVLAAGRRVAGHRAGPAAERRRAGPTAWLAALGSALAEIIVYLGLVLGAAADHRPGAWKLGVTVVGLVAVRGVMSACSTPYGFSDPPATTTGRIGLAVVTMAAAGRILVMGLAALVWGTHTALLVLAGWAIGSIAYGLAGRPSGAVLAEGTQPDGSGPVVGSATLLRLRDDGALARALGALARGILLPLPPALLGLAAVSALAVLGLHGLPGMLTIGPAIVMLLAAPGSASPHAGRLDWLVPVLLVSAQVLYLAAVSDAERVPGPVTFALLAAVLVRYAELACARRPVLLVRPRRGRDRVREYGTELGWEGRLLFVGITAAMGIATAGYLALTVYLVALVGAKIVRSCLTPDEGLR